MLKSLSRNSLLNVALFAIFFLVLTATTFWSTPKTFSILWHNNHLNIQSYYDFLRLSADAFASAFGAGDNATYVKFAHSLLVTGFIDPSVLALWPPGQFFILATLFKIFGENYYPLKMIILNLLVWSVMLVFVFRSLIGIKNSLLRFLLALAPFYFLLLRDFFLGEGIFLSENMSAPVFVIAICFFLRWLHTGRTFNLIMMAFCMAIAAYIRGYFELFGHFLINILFLLLIIGLVRDYWLQRRELSLRGWLKQVLLLQRPFFTKRKKAIFLAVITFMLLLMPWRLYMHRHFDSYEWQHQDFVWQQFWDPKSPWITGNSPCLIRPQLCQVLYQHDQQGRDLIDYVSYKNLTLGVFILYPIRWYTIKFAHFNNYWFAYGSWHDLIHGQPWQFVSGCIIILFGIGGYLLMLYLLRKYSSVQLQAFTLFSYVFLLFNFMLFTLMHFEPRYSIFLRLYFVYLPLWVLFSLPDGISSFTNKMDEFLIKE